MPLEPQWYRNAVIYQVHVRSFNDSNGDGIGDFNGLIAKLDYLEELGVTAVWVMPFYPSPLKDDGYDIADYTSVNPAYGTADDVRRFIQEAHRRNIRVITELVINHTSDQHAWFQRARRAPKGSPERDFYVWSDTNEKYSGVRIIFKDFEPSNWTFDREAGQFYWHRFFHHQPDLNFDNPAVHEAVFRVLDFWMDAGVDGVRLDAVPYLYEREGTSCENLPETHGFLKKMRAYVDQHYPGRMLLAEANQWPEDAIAYFGDGDECHMNFHFPLMPRLFMSLRMEDRYPIIDILEQTPPLPANAQWAMFLRNHDELTLEMVTDEERDYMWRVYASDPAARINMGIRRRLAPLLDNSRRKMELMNGLLFSMPGSPIVYYGDEIGMGDNIFLGDRNGVRTPMQWSADRNAGFSRANPQRLFLPIIIDPEYHYETVNVEAQMTNPSSLAWWMKRLIALRKRHPVFGRGDVRFLTPSNAKVLAFLRRDENEQVLVIANLSRFSQPVELDLCDYRGATPVEMFGNVRFPAVGEDGRYVLSMGPHGFFWFVLEPAVPRSEDAQAVPEVRINAPGQSLLTEDAFARELQNRLPRLLPSRRWFVSKARSIRSVQLTERLPIRSGGGGGGKARGGGGVGAGGTAAAQLPRASAEPSGAAGAPAIGTTPAGTPVATPAGMPTTVQRDVAQRALMIAHVEYTDGEPEEYVLPLALSTADAWQAAPGGEAAVLLRVTDREQRSWVVYDGMTDPEFARILLKTAMRGREIGGDTVRLTGRRIGGGDGAALPDLAALPIRLPDREQSNTNVLFGEHLILKLYRRLGEGLNPELEIGEHLTARVGFTNTAPLAGAIEVAGVGRGAPRTLAVVLTYVPNEGDAWGMFLDHAQRYFEGLDALTAEQAAALCLPGDAGCGGGDGEGPPQDIISAVATPLELARLLGRRTAEMHAAMADDRGSPGFAPEPFSGPYQRSLLQSMRNTTRAAFGTLAKRLGTLSGEARQLAESVLGREAAIMTVFKGMTNRPILRAIRIRIHGDYHLGQVLWTGKDFVIIDFEGEPLRPVSERRLRRTPLRDVAGMVRSFDYAAWTALRRHWELLPPDGNPAVRERDVKGAAIWAAWLGREFVRAYVARVRELRAELIPPEAAEIEAVLRSWVLQKALYEVSYELNSRPDWVDIPLRAIATLLGAADATTSGSGSASASASGAAATSAGGTAASGAGATSTTTTSANGGSPSLDDIHGRKERGQ